MEKLFFLEVHVGVHALFISLGRVSINFIEVNLIALISSTVFLSSRNHRIEGLWNELLRKLALLYGFQILGQANFNGCIVLKIV